MTNRTTINVTKTSHRNAVDVKDEHDDSWSDVLGFYAEHKDSLSNNDIGQEKDPIQDIDGMDYDDVVSACRTAIREELPVGEL